MYHKNSFFGFCALVLISSACAQSTRISPLDDGRPSDAVKRLIGAHRCTDETPAFIGGEYFRVRGETFMLIRFRCPENEYLVIDAEQRYETHLITRSVTAREPFVDLYRHGESVYLELGSGAVWQYSWHVNGGRLVDERGKDVPFEPITIVGR